MGQKKRVLSLVVALILLVIIAFLNNIVGIISIPDAKLMQDRQVDFITISTVFAGFSFTALGVSSQVKYTFFRHKVHTF